MSRISSALHLFEKTKSIMKRIHTLFLLAAIVALFVQCDNKKETPETHDSTKVKVVSGITDNDFFTVELLASDSLFVGYNKLYLKITQKSNGEVITAGDITIKPIMKMVNKSHGAPFENPGTTANTDDYFECAVVLIMPSNPDEGWVLNLDIEAQGLSDQLTLELPDVKSLEEPKSIRFISPANGKTYFISLLNPLDPEVGVNELEFTAHYMEDMMTFPADENLAITFEPEMPSMNHGSPNNVQPEHGTDGHYLGKINFTMTGWWRINVAVSKNGEFLADDIEFNITF